jgi:hypothetical protein
LTILRKLMQMAGSLLKQFSRPRLEFKISITLWKSRHRRIHFM